MKTNLAAQQSGSVRYRAFTLMEVLVVIVIIAVLASVTFSIVNKALEKAAVTKTMGNMKQLATVSRVFSSDNNDAIMDTWQTVASDGQKRQWSEHILVMLSNELAQSQNYSKSPGDQFAQTIGIFSDPKAIKQAHGKLATSGHYSWRSFGYNNRLGAFIPQNPGTNPWKQGAKYTSQVSSPNKLLLYSQPTLSGDRFNYFIQPNDAASGKIDFDLHGGKAIVGFFDGHVELFTKANFPGNSGINPNNGAPYTTQQINEFWFGSVTPFTAP